MKLQIWDTAGQEAFRSITKIFYKGADCIFLVYDITKDETFVNIVDWIKEVNMHASSQAKVYLVGNRKDLEEEREVSVERAMQLCKAKGIERFFETSAKTGHNVEEVFSTAAKELYVLHRKPLSTDPTPSDSKLIQPTQRRKSGG